MLLLCIDMASLIVRYHYARNAASICDPAGRPVGGAVGALYRAAALIANASPAYLLVARDGSRAASERRKLDPQYKAHRPAPHPDLTRNIELTYQALELLRWPVVEAEGYEADDVIASACAMYRSDVRIVTSDKDMLALCSDRVKVRLLRSGDDDRLCGPEDCKNILGVRPDQVQDFRAMAGNRSSGITGVRGIGEATAEDALAKHDTLEGIYTRLTAGESLEGISDRHAKLLLAGHGDAQRSWKLAGLKRDLKIDGPALDIAPARTFHQVREALSDLGLEQLFSYGRSAPNHRSMPTAAAS